jgi:hypothetical protein
LDEVFATFAIAIENAASPGARLVNGAEVAVLVEKFAIIIVASSVQNVAFNFSVAVLPKYGVGEDRTTAFGDLWLSLGVLKADFDNQAAAAFTAAAVALDLGRQIVIVAVFIVIRACHSEEHTRGVAGAQEEWLENGARQGSGFELA